MSTQPPTIIIEQWCYRTIGGDFCYDVGHPAIPTVAAHQAQSYPELGFEPIEIKFIEVPNPDYVEVETTTTLPLQENIEPVDTSLAIDDTPQTTVVVTIDSTTITVESIVMPVEDTIATTMAEVAVGEPPIPPYQTDILPSTGGSEVAIMFIALAMITSGASALKLARRPIK